VYGPDKNKPATGTRSGAERVLFISDDVAAREAFENVCHTCGYDADVISFAATRPDELNRHRYALIVLNAADCGAGFARLAEIRRGQVDAALILAADQQPEEIPPKCESAGLVVTVVPRPWSLSAVAELLSRGIRLHHERVVARKTSGTHSLVQRVLLVEDDDNDAFITQSMLTSVRGSRYRAHRVRSIGEALDELANEDFEALLLDLSLPDSNGVDAIKDIRALHPELPIAVLTGLDDEAVGLQALDAGAQDYLLKSSVTGRDLVRAIRYAVERKHSEQRMLYLAYHDQVTGLANRSMLKERLGPALLRARRAGTRVGVIYLGLDRFKAFNEALGRDAGDAVLVEVAHRLERGLRSHEAVTRIGGDEFVLVVEDLSSEADAARIAERLLECMSKTFRIGERDLVVTTSIGIAITGPEGSSVGELLKQSEAAMRRSKASGPNKFQFYTQAAQIRTVTRLDLEGELRGALERDEYVLHYQPQIDMRTGRVTGAEALLRWQQKGIGLVPPFKFIPLLEETRLIIPVGAWVLEESCRTLKRMHEAGFGDLRIAVNVSGYQFEDSNFTQVVADALRYTRLSPGQLELEITESVLMQDTEASRQTLTDLKAKNIRLAVDDFGTGYSSLQYLKRFNIDVLKIDRSFIMNILSDDGDAQIARAVVGLGKALDLEVVAEGVEEAEQLEPLRGWGCDLVQGFYYAKPMTEADFVAWMEARGERDCGPVRTRDAA
jgi:diguanylate cyclase (GGDEF)-like protein